ncbi:type II toxin-antitoxin system PemK/MazF family toxin [Bacillaceae bacterium IKA-2]|nr:type II toxin-antitoxin system PemK/MazF family toxin [Bacillaceae bacterium IKA-2]
MDLLIFSRKTRNEFCPITNQEKGYPFEESIPVGYKVEGVILTDQVKSLDWRSRRLKIVDQAPPQTVSNCFTLIHTFL